MTSPIATPGVGLEILRSIDAVDAQLGETLRGHPSEVTVLDSDLWPSVDVLTVVVRGLVRTTRHVFARLHGQLRPLTSPAAMVALNRDLGVRLDEGRALKYFSLFVRCFPISRGVQVLDVEGSTLTPEERVAAAPYLLAPRAVDDGQRVRVTAVARRGTELLELRITMTYLGAVEEVTSLSLSDAFSTAA